jgi:uncharacterized membrane protein
MPVVLTMLQSISQVFRLVNQAAQIQASPPASAESQTPAASSPRVASPPPPPLAAPSTERERPSSRVSSSSRRMASEETKEPEPIFADEIERSMHEIFQDVSRGHKVNEVGCLFLSSFSAVYME